MIRSMLTRLEQRWLVPTYASPHATTWIAAHQCLTLPFRLRGEMRRYERLDTDQPPLVVVTIGAPMRLQRFCERLIGPLAERGGARHRTLWRPESIDAYATPAEVEGQGQAGGTPDLVIAQIHPWAAGRFRRAGWSIVPDAVRWQAELSAIPPSPPSKSLRDDLRKIRQHRYEVRAAETAADWTEFFETMLVPQAERFGDAAWLPSPGFFGALRKAGHLHFVVREGVRVGGFCVVPAGDRAWYPVMGTLAADEALRRDGVIAAVYGLGIEWAKARGYRTVDKGRTAAFVNDGIAAYKRKWGLAPVPDPLSLRFAVKVGGNPAVADVFARQPVWTETDAGLEMFGGATA